MLLLEHMSREAIVALNQVAMCELNLTPPPSFSLLRSHTNPLTLFDNNVQIISFIYSSRMDSRLLKSGVQKILTVISQTKNAAAELERRIKRL